MQEMELECESELFPRAESRYYQKTKESLFLFIRKTKKVSQY